MQRFRAGLASIPNMVLSLGVLLSVARVPVGLTATADRSRSSRSFHSFVSCVVQLSTFLHRDAMLPFKPLVAPHEVHGHNADDEFADEPFPQVTVQTLNPLKIRPVSVRIRPGAPRLSRVAGAPTSKDPANLDHGDCGPARLSPARHGASPQNPAGLLRCAGVRGALAQRRP